MKKQWYVGPAALVLMASVGHQVMAQPDPNQVAKAVNPPAKQRKVAGGINAIGRAKADKIALGPRAATLEITQLEGILGKPLTDKQRQAVEQSLAARNEVIVAAQKNYQTEVAQTLGMTLDDLLLKRRTYLKAHRNAQLEQPVAQK